MTTPVPAPDDHAGDPLVQADLVQRLLDHAELVCETGAEAPLADKVTAHYRARGDELRRIGNSLVIGAPSGLDRPLVVLAGHLDVVAPTPADRLARVEVIDDVEVVVARGASDMKSGNVVAMRLFEAVADGAVAATVDLVLVLYAAEEGPAEGNELALVLDQASWLASADLAVILEPTDGEIQLGCLGGLHANVTVHGRSAHSARPWQGRNALTAAGRLLTKFDEIEPVEVVLDGVTFRDVWSVTQLTTSNGRNVIPGSITFNLNFRYSPSRSPEEAATELTDRVATMASHLDLEVTVKITDQAPPAHPNATRAVTARFIDRVGAPVAAKQAWTDVARFAGLDIPAVNFGPGRGDQAHQRGEFVETWRLAAAYDALVTFVSS